MGANKNLEQRDLFPGALEMNKQPINFVRLDRCGGFAWMAI
jgi:hypothetical protein